LKVSVSASPDVLPHSRTMPSKFLPSSAPRDAGAGPGAIAMRGARINSARRLERLDMKVSRPAMNQFCCEAMRRAASVLAPSIRDSYARARASIAGRQAA
jgi:hypothetical protein